MSPHDCQRNDKFEDIADCLQELKTGGEKRWDAIGKKVSWSIFTWIIGILLLIWMATQGFILTRIEAVGAHVIKIDKKLAVHMGPREIQKSVEENDH